jgi:glucokinase
MRLVAGVDIGGTNVRCALADETGKILVSEKERIRTGSEREIVRQISSMVVRACKRRGVCVAELAGVGIASTGPLDMRRGSLMKPTNIPLPEVRLVGPVEEELGIPVVLLNDCTAAVLGEARFGAGRGVEDLVYVGIGTGIGGGAIVDGNLLFGKDGNACEIGHVVVDPLGKMICGCGKRGHWEAYCSGKNIPAYARLRLEEMGAESKIAGMDAKGICAEARRGDRIARRIVAEVAEFNAIGLADVVNVYDPFLVTVGGSVALGDPDLVVEPAVRRMGRYLRNRRAKVKLTPLGGDAGLLGAVAAATDPSVIPKRFRRASRLLR